MKKSLTFILPLALTLSGLAFIGTASAEEAGTTDVKINVVPKPLLIKDRVGSATTTKAREALKINAEKRDALRTATSSEKREAVKERADYRRTAVKEKVDAKRRAQIKEIAERTIKRLVAATERLEKLSDRLESRLDKLSAGGVDVSKSKNCWLKRALKSPKPKPKLTKPRRK